MPEFIDPVFTKTSPKRSFSLNRKRAFWLVFAKTGSIISGTGLVWWIKTAQYSWEFGKYQVVLTSFSKTMENAQPRKNDRYSRGKNRRYRAALAQKARLKRQKLWTLKICVRLSSHLSLACQAFMAIYPVPLNNSAVSPFFANTNKNNIFGFIDSTVQYSTYITKLVFVLLRLFSVFRFLQCTINKV